MVSPENFIRCKFYEITSRKSYIVRELIPIYLAFSWIEPKSRLRREGDADDEKVLKFLDAKEKIAESKKLVRAGPSKPPSKPGTQKFKKWQMKNGKVLNKKGKWVTPSKRRKLNTVLCFFALTFKQKSLLWVRPISFLLEFQ